MAATPEHPSEQHPDQHPEPLEGLHEPLLRVAVRLLGTRTEAEPVVTEVGRRAADADPAEVFDLATWARTEVARACLRLLLERSPGRRAADASLEPAALVGPEDLADLYLDVPDDPAAARPHALTLTASARELLAHLRPAERVAFVLHDLFGDHFEDVAGVLGRTPMACRQLADRARRRLAELRRAADAGIERLDRDAADRAEDLALDAVVTAALAAPAGLEPLLSPAVVLRADPAAADPDGPLTGLLDAAYLSGPAAVAAALAPLLADAVAARLDGYPAVVRRDEGGVRAVVGLALDAAGRVREVDVLADPDVLAVTDLS
ncbi:sigma factor-like helix-turn-helix DNA-binding protein [Nocardioides bruguierae]|uniref:sigma factor-like helix-turn-helix DNA-binding protein n=1 Tax=Nocardioides bruguierae TaxID=2945102 RepID=UPI00201FCCAE|nr:sigma factor-like helix-turn-helix DNA-binding protein [Nocardioides bruguierae]MCL8026659.1 hypothetical protein [Nocardioides bruguierae]